MFFTSISNVLNNFQGDTIICGGDLNFVFNLDLDKIGGNKRTNFKAREKCLALMDSHNLIDIWRERNPFVKNYTWSSNVTPGIHCRLDYFLISRPESYAVTDNVFSPGIQSDHSFICLSISTQLVSRGPGYWKLNNSLLHDQIYIDLINELIRNGLEKDTDQGPTRRWEMLKFNIRKTSMTFSKDRAKERRAKEHDLINKIAELEQQLYLEESANVRSRFKEAHNELMLLYDYKLRGTIIRSRARWVEEGEKKLIFFLI